MPTKSASDTSTRHAGLVVQHMSEVVVVTDEKGLTEWCNPAFTRLTGYTLDEIRGRSPGSVLQGPETDPVTVARVREAILARRPTTCEILNYTKLGTPYWIEMSIIPIFDETGQPTNMIAIERDITERKRLADETAEVRAREAQVQHERKLFAQTSEWLYSAKSLEELMMVTRRAMQTLMPEGNGALYIYTPSRDWLDLAESWGDGDPPPPQITPDSCWALRRGRAYAYGTRAIEFPCEHTHDYNAPYFCIPIIANGETIGLLHLNFPAYDRTLIPRSVIEPFLQQRWDLALLCGEQISLAIANVRLRQQLHDQSMRDPLTNLWNRRWFLEAASREFVRARMNGTPVSLISIDVDHFKRFNDDHGHDAGDAVLRHVGTILASHCSGDTFPCRLGGEEFVVLCPGRDAAAAAALADALREDLGAAAVVHMGKPLPRVTASAGVAAFPGDGAEVLTVLKAADVALYEAKAGGRNRVVAARRPSPSASPEPSRVANIHG